ncbi:MAG: hypothetical protein SFW35_11495 [Chitinophagales bacterium]|nr:hypothetical protein [Chitinophagales bacterium]
MHWRVRQADRLIKRYIWNVKRSMDASPKETVDKVSIVVVGRNDNYGGDFSDRLRATIDWNYGHIPNAELIYVEWNTIADRPSDTEWISKRYPNSKCFIVPNDIHLLYNTNPKIPMMEYHAKNVGIRQASNNWIGLINADVFLAENTIANMAALSKSHIYGTHYINIKWKGEVLTKEFLSNKKIVLHQFSTDKVLHSVVGNFIMTHRDNWWKATGYDERLTDVRDGVDTNGLRQLQYMGLKPMVIGDHYHLDHNESRIYGFNETHGNNRDFNKAITENIPYKNKDNWGLADFPKKQIAENIWVFQKI